MLISLIVAVAKNGVIGNKGQLPWHLPADLKYFKSVTMGKPIIMGRQTYDSIGHVLPGRTNIVITRQSDLQLPGALIAQSPQAALELDAIRSNDEIFVIGGANIFQQVLAQAHRVYITYIDHEFAGDCYFPVLNLQEWHEISRENHSGDEHNAYPYSFVVYERG